VVLWRVHVELEDRPGRLGELATAVGRAGCNIISLHVVGEPADDGSVTDELLVRVPTAGDPAVLVDEIQRAGIPCTLLVRADAGELADPATTALALARMVAADPGSAPRAVATMLRARLVDPAADATTGHVHTLRIGAAQVRLRPATSADALLVGALHARCSPATRRARFLSPTPRLGPGELEGLLGGQAVLAVTTDGGSAVAVANLDADSDGPGVGRCAVLVDNAWQGRGLGTALVRRLADAASEEGLAELAGRARPDDLGVIRVLRRAGLRPTAEVTDGVIHLRAPLCSTS